MSDARHDPASPASRLATALSALARGLYNAMSESTDPFTPFSAAMEKATELTAESFRAAAGIGRRFRVDVRPGDEFFARMQDPELMEPGDIAGFALLEKVMRSALTDLRWVVVGEGQVVRVRGYVFGRMDDGNLVGLRTMTTET